jgi:hypothetical protein
VIELLLTLVIIGFVAWLILTYVPMVEPIRTIVIVIFVIILILWLLGLVRGGVPALTL